MKSVWASTRIESSAHKKRAQRSATQRKTPMPKITFRQQQLDQLELVAKQSLKQLLLDELSGKRSSEEDSIVLTILDFYRTRSVMRFWLERKYERMNLTTLSSMRNDMNEDKFRTNFRMSHEMFGRLVLMIQNHCVFAQSGRRRQAPAAFQLMVCLKRLGCNGNAAGVVSCCIMFTISLGAVDLYTNRCLEALLDLQSTLIRWPSIQERQRIAEKIEVSPLALYIYI